MRRGRRASPVITIAYGAPPDQRRARDRCPSKRQGTFAGGHPRRKIRLTANGIGPAAASPRGKDTA